MRNPSETARFEKRRNTQTLRNLEYRRMNTTRITKIGNSKGIIIPSEIIKALVLEEGDEVELNYDPISETLTSIFHNSKQLKLVPQGSDLEGSPQPEGKVRP